MAVNQILASRAATEQYSVSKAHILLVLACLFASAADGFDVAAVSFAILPISQSMHFSPAMIGGVLSISMLGAGIGAFLCGPMSRLWGRKTTLILSLIWFALGSIATLAVSSYPGLLLVRFLTGLGLGVPTPLILASIGDTLPQKIKAFALGITQAGIPLGGVLAGLVASHWISTHGWQIEFIVGTALPLVILPFIVFAAFEPPVARVSSLLIPLADPSRPSRQSPFKAYADIFRKGQAPRAIATFGIVLFGSTLLAFLQNWTPTLLARLGFSFQQAAISGTLLNFGTIGAALIFGYLIDRLGVFRVAGLGYLIAVPLIIALGNPHAEPNALYFIAFLAGFFAVGSQLGGAYLLATGASSETRVYFTTIGYIVAKLGAVLGPFTVGLLLQRGLSIFQVLLVAAAVALAACSGIACLSFISARERAHAGSVAAI
jgi:MFS family permease